MSKPQSPSSAAKRAFWTTAAQASSEGTVIETLKNWGVLPAGVQLIEEEHSFDVTYNGKTVPGEDIAYSGKVSLTCRFFLVGDRKIPTTERPKTHGDLHAVSSRGTPYGLLLAGYDLAAVEEEDERVTLVLRTLPRVGHPQELRLRTQIAAARA